jgi:hypothetical protein
MQGFLDCVTQVSQLEAHRPFKQVVSGVFPRTLKKTYLLNNLQDCTVHISVEVENFKSWPATAQTFVNF